MKSFRFTDRFKTLFDLALRLSETSGADAVLLLLEGSADWARLKKMAGEEKLLVAGDTAEQLEGAKEAGLDAVPLDMPDSPVHDRLSQALLEAVTDDVLRDAGKETAAVSWPVTVGAPITRNFFPEIWSLDRGQPPLGATTE